MAVICVIDDEAVMRDSVAAALERCDHTVTTISDPFEAAGAVGRQRFDLILTDLKMPGLDGLGVIRAVREAKCDAPIIVMTAFGSVATAVEAMRLGAFDFVQKPFEADGLAMRVERALQHKQLRGEVEAYKRSLDDLRGAREMFGESEAMQVVRTQIAQYAASDATVLISGESGTGKELAAAALHADSPRADRPMLCLNCAALSGNLLESELFGHERGAFTGADRLRKGRFELAHGGTLLLDEISEMALPLQAKLLRVLQEGEFERVGSCTTQRANVRVIATTNRVLEDRVNKKRFRADLYYRLNVLPLHLPPLRERREDVPLLTEYFLSRSASESGAAKLSVEPDAMVLLQAYDWPGNIRELENLCRRATATVKTAAVGVGDVGHWLSNEPTREDSLSQLRPGRMLEDSERRLIEQVLNQYGGHRVRTAKTLGMGVRTLGLKLKQWREQDEANTARRPALQAV